MGWWRNDNGDAVGAEVLDLADTKLGKQLAKTFVKGVKLEAILRLLGDRVEPDRLPAWITWHTGKGFDTVGHLGEPLFCATGAIPADARATPSLDATCVYTWSPRGILAVDRSTGKQKWLAKLDQKRSDDDKTFAITGDRLLTRANGKLASFNLATGKAQWSVGLDTPYYIGNCGPAVGGGVAVCILIDDDTTRGR